MATLEVIELLVRGPAGGTSLGSAAVCMVLVAATGWIDGATAATSGADPRSGRAVTEGGRVDAGPTFKSAGAPGQKGVEDVDAVTTRMIDAHAEQVAPPTTSPWRSLDSRLDAPAPIHLTLFQELDPETQP